MSGRNVFSCFGALAATAVVACGTPRAPSATAPPAARTGGVAPCEISFGAPASFALDRRTLTSKGATPKLLAKLDASAYRYFRAIGPEFALRTCAAFRDVRWRLPLVAVHGDAHVEQFVVTPTTAGVEDFDQSGFGPAVVDLVRYAASLHLACREVAWSCDAEAAVGAYFRAYREALDHAPTRKAPGVVARLRQNSPQTKQEWLTWADSLMQPLSPADDARVRRGWVSFRRLLAEIRPERAPAFYDVVRMGALQMGIGSGLETKVLFRIRGATDAPADDVVIEARSSTPPRGDECAWRPPHGGSLQPLMFQSILGARMPDTYGFATLDESGREFWVQAWDPGYRELAVTELKNQAELLELAEDAARQLAGHFWTRFPEALRLLQRRAQLEAFDLVDARARTIAREFAAETTTEWRRFRASGQSP